ncbi:hypothetical protein [Haloplanus aerogenes]|uniref:Uncharacterized protein n=1 Tax=Haloplanus aerogenes TaxID=660522 RepID=A0A3M0CWM0_9EURY|nr:hypothetical protein [Haloplanus aerogenes]AZH24138.1 hypothetical protein DU502_01550 [Haloplanus aerogenes]RMB08223.1 hypothetical protein ATH50_3690 [Haloplanus aerogenes]
MSTPTRRVAVRPALVGSLLLVLLGLVVSTVATSLALDAGEPPATVLPGRLGLGLAAIVFVRIAGVCLLWGVATRWRPRARVPLLAAAGVFWVLWGLWQAWLLLART